MPNRSRTAGESDCRGGGFISSHLTGGDVAHRIFTPEDFSEEQRMIRDLAARFVAEEVLPQQPNIEHQDWALTVKLLRRSADLGLVGIDVPEHYGGASLDRVSAMIVAEQMGRVASFSVSFGGQSGIGTLPILYFGTEELRKKYLPLLCSAQKLSAYALSEAGSGSDALAAKTTATRSPDGTHWVLNGEKMWVTNAAFADVFITFAQIDGKQFSCFVVEREFPGVSTGAEERKMGLKGSSTRPLVLNEVCVPIGNLVGEAGRGHEVALNILNIGRVKLGAAAVGSSKTALNDAIAYSKQRMAFGRPIASFGAIQHKLAEMAIRIWINEGLVYRTASLMDQAIDGIDPDDRKQVLPALREYAVECSIVKVYASEALDYVVDEAVQIFGGYGFSAEYPVERYYRDSRVYRIFEGTNEINRLMIAGMLLKRLRNPADLTEPSGKPSAEAIVIDNAKKVFYMVARNANTDTAQELLMLLANIAIDIYAVDTAFRRARQIEDRGGSAEIVTAIFRTFLNDAISRITRSARQVLVAMIKDSIGEQLAAIDSLLKWTPVDTVSSRRRIAEQLLESGYNSLSR